MSPTSPAARTATIKRAIERARLMESPFSPRDPMEKPSSGSNPWSSLLRITDSKIWTWREFAGLWMNDERKSKMRGAATSPVEVSIISAKGFWLLVDDRELFLPFDEFPWFKE